MAEQAVVLCQVEKAKEDMLNQLYSSIRLVSSILEIMLSVGECACRDLLHNFY